MVLDGLHEGAGQCHWEVAFYHLGKVAIRESPQWLKKGKCYAHLKKTQNKKQQDPETYKPDKLTSVPRNIMDWSSRVKVGGKLTRPLGKKGSHQEFEGWVWLVSPSGVNTRPVPFASSETTQMTGMAHIFIKFVEGAVVYAGRQSYCSESSNSGVAWQGPQKIQQRQNRSPVLEQHSPLEQYRLEVR